MLLKDLVLSVPGAVENQGKPEYGDRQSDNEQPRSDPERAFLLHQRF